MSKRALEKGGSRSLPFSSQTLAGHPQQHSPLQLGTGARERKPGTASLPVFRKDLDWIQLTQHLEPPYP
jgi:hypothetical protein